MASSETLTVIIRGRDDISKQIGKLLKGLDQTQRKAKRTTRAIQGMGRALRSIGKSVVSLRSAFLGLGIGLLASRFIKASNEQQKAIEGLNAALRAMGRFTPTLSKSLQQTATSLQAITNFGDEATIEGTKFLATYRNIGDDVLPRAQKAMLDYAALTGGDTVQAANALGKASIGMVGDLRRVGIIVSANTFATEGFVGVLKEIEDQVGGQAEAMRLATGSMVAFGNVTGDTGEFIGDLLKLALEPLMKALVESFDALNQRIQKLKDEGKLHEWAQVWALAIINFLTTIAKIIGRVADAWRGWKLIFQVLKIAFASFGELYNKIWAKIIGVAEMFVRVWGRVIEAIGKGLKAVGKFLGIGKGFAQTVENIGKSLKSFTGVSDVLKENAKFWKESKENAQDQLDVLLKQPSNYEKIMKTVNRIRAQALKYVADIKLMEEAQGKLSKTQTKALASFKAMTKSALLHLTEETKIAMAKLQEAFDAGEIGVVKLFKRRRELLTKEFEATMKTLQTQLALERDPTKALGIEDKIFKAKSKFALDEIKLNKDKNDAILAEKQRMISIETLMEELRRKAGEGAGGLEGQQEEERQNLLAEQATTFAQLEEQLKGHKDKEALLTEAHRLQELERDKQAGEQRLAIQEAVLTGISETLGGLEQAFGEAFEASGKKIKAFFLLQKAAAIAQTIISTYQGAQSAYKSALEIPIVGKFLAPIAAATAVAAGLARVATIRAQTFAMGGPVEGSSPTKVSDNIPAMLTAGEFVHPVKTVQHYGAGAMEAIRKRMVPKSLLQDFIAPTIKRNYGYAFQAGGPVRPGRNIPEGEGGDRGVVIANFYDPEELSRFLATSRGQDAVVNAIAGRAGTVRRVLQ